MNAHTTRHLPSPLLAPRGEGHPRPRWVKVQAGLLALLALILLRAESCEQDLLDNPGFDIWCGERLCGWEVDEGQVARVPTWHERDYGVSLVGERVRLSQRLSDRQPRCLAFDLQVDRDEDVGLFLDLDFLDDGVIEYHHPIPANDWEPVQYQLSAPEWYDQVRFTIRKEGAGRAVLSRIRVTVGEDCKGDPIQLRNVPLGLPCSDSQQCASARCEDWNVTLSWADSGRSCAECRTDEDCGEGRLCSLNIDGYSQDLLAGSQGPIYRACVALGSKALGRPCEQDGECASGICSDEGSCSACATNEDCPGDQRCGPVPWWELQDGTQDLVLPRLCAALSNQGQPGAPCLWDRDCESDTCRPGAGDDFSLRTLGSCERSTEDPPSSCVPRNGSCG